MSSWDEFLNSARKAFNKAAVKVNDFADTAADSIKIETLKLKLSEKYEDLGRILYEQMKSKSDVSMAEKAADKAAEIEAILLKIEALRDKKEKKKSESEKTSSGTDSEKTDSESSAGTEQNTKQNTEQNTEAPASDDSCEK